MRKFLNIRYSIPFIAIALTLVSCTSNVRFASKAKYTKDYIAESNEITHITKKQTPSSNSQIDNSYGTFNYDGLNDWQLKLVNESEKWLGVPYVWGGTSANGVDCSGFVQNVYAALGVSLPRTAALQYEAVEKIDDTKRQAGDLIFFQKKDYISHVGIYVGNDMVVHASTSRGVVYEDLYCTFFTNNFVGFGRVNLKEKKIGFLGSK